MNLISGLKSIPLFPNDIFFFFFFEKLNLFSDAAPNLLSFCGSVEDMVSFSSISATGNALFLCFLTTFLACAQFGMVWAIFIWFPSAIDL